MTSPVQTLAAASALVGGAAWAGVYYAAYAVRSQVLGPAAWCGRTDTASVALTFDDGPSDDTERILDALAACDVHAAFFMIGREVERRPQTARRIVAGGHEVGNHSYSHPIYLYQSPRDTRAQLARAQHAISGVTGVEPLWARPPCGVRTPAYFRAARALGLRTVQWTVAGFDWRNRGPEEIARLVVRRAAAGSIILLHDGDNTGRRDRRATAAALPAIVNGLKARGLRTASLAHLLEIDRADRAKGRVE